MNRTPGSDRHSASSIVRSTTILLLLAVAAGCATTGATLGSGLGERITDSPPYYSGQREAATPGRIIHLPIAYQPGAEQPAFFDPEGGPGTPIAAILGEMNRALESLDVSRSLADGTIIGGTPPDVRFGCDRDPFGDCMSASEDVGTFGAPWLKLAVGRPSTEWKGALGKALIDADADHALVITLEVGEYWPRQKNLRGDKEVYLGAGHTVSVPWLTSLDQPVQVLQLTGALVDREGRAVRIGAEGLAVRPTPILASGVGLQAVIGGDDVVRLQQARREDLHGAPLVWQVALTNLAAQLTGQRMLDVR